MEYFKSGLKSVLGTPTAENIPSGAETVEMLVNRVLSSTLIDDRRDACRALKALSRTYRLEVGTQGMDALKHVLNVDRNDSDIIGLVLQTLCNVISSETFEEEVDKYGQKHNIGEQFTEILLKDQDVVSQILRFLEDFDFKIRWSALKLLANLLSNKLKDTQEIILISPMGVSKLMDMLSDSREVIRNEALLLLIQLTKGNANIQKIVAFENAFDRICDVISQEGAVDGGIVVEDCLLLMVNLLRGNYSNQNFFKEGSYIQKLTPMFQMITNIDDINQFQGWSSQKVSNVHCMIQVIRVLVAPSGPAQLVSGSQGILKTSGLLQALCDILMMSGVPADILSEIINAVAEIIRGNASNQEFLANVMAPSSPPRPLLVILLMSMVNAKQPFPLRCAVLYCFQCFLHKNEAKQLELVQTLLPEGNESSSLTTGQLLCGGLFSTDSISNWFSAVALSHALIDDIRQKEQLLRVLLATNIGTPPVTLLHQCILFLQQSNKIQSKLGHLILLCRWTAYNSSVVQQFLSVDSAIPYLIAFLSSHDTNDDLQEMLLQNMCALLIGICVHFNNDTVPNYTKVKLCTLIENRIGLEKFQDVIGSITKHEIYSRSIKHPQPSAKTSSDILLDHEFCRLLKILEGAVLKSVLDYSNSDHEEQIRISTPPDSVLIAQYKELIRVQDSQIEKLEDGINKITKEKQELENQISELKYEISSLTDQMKVLRATQTNYQKEESSNNHLHSVPTNAEYETRIKDLESQLTESMVLIKELQNKVPENYKKAFEEKQEAFDKLKKDQEDLLELLLDQDNKLALYKAKLIALGEKIDSDGSLGDIDVDNQAEAS